MERDRCHDVRPSPADRLNDGAYVIQTDPTTKDPTYLGAQLGAKPK